VHEKSFDPPSRPPAGAAGADGGMAATAGNGLAAMPMATFGIGDVVRHRLFPFRGVIFDVDPQFANTEEWWQSIPENVRPRKDQPFYHLLAENDDASYVAYVSQQNLVREESAEPVQHPGIEQMFETFRDGRYVLRNTVRN
jgi:heat shock protein HspQ